MEGVVISETTGAPLKNAVVLLEQVQESFKKPVARPMTQQTNEEGRFYFAAVPSGDWELTADRRGFATGRYEASKFNPQGRRITVKPKQQLRDLVLKLIPQSVIAGRILDNDGEPVEGLRVAVLKAGYAEGAPRWAEVASATTLDNGQYRVPRVGPGRYLVRCGSTATDSSGLETTYAPRYYPDASEPSQASMVEVREDGNEIGGLDMRVAPIRVYQVRGRFHSPDGREAAVFLLERSDPSKIFAKSVARLPDYLFNFPRVPPGSYVVYGYSMAGAGVRATQLVDVKSDDVDGLILSAAAGEIRGSVIVKSASRQVDLSAMSVSIRPIWFMPGSYPMPGRVKLTDDLKFRYPVVGREFASFSVAVSETPDDCYVLSIQYGGRDVPDSGIEYSYGAPLEITIATDGARVDGSTVDKDQNPFANAVVALVPTDGVRATRSLNSGPRGVFHFTGVPPGEYKLLAWDDVTKEDLENPGFVKRFEDQATPVRLAPSGTASASVHVAAPERNR